MTTMLTRRPYRTAGKAPWRPGFGAAPAILAVALLGLTLSVPTAEAGDRSVTILQGLDEPTPDVTPLPEGVAPPAALHAENPAGLKLDILPNADLHVGTRIAFSISTDTPGFLVLVDINAEGKLTQIFPNIMSLSQSSTAVGSTNQLKPGKAITIPNPKNPLARFVFTADPPLGHGAIVAILSDKPVQIIDLPDIPPSAAGTQGLVDALYQSVQNLRIASAEEAGKFSQATWSFAAAPYVIK